MALQPPYSYIFAGNARGLYDAGLLTLRAIEDALARRDPCLAELIVKLAQFDPVPVGLAEARKQGKFTYIDLIESLSSAQNLRKGEIDRLVRTLKAQGIVHAAGEMTFEFGAMPRQQLREVIVDLHRRLWSLLEGEANRPFLPERVLLDGIIERLWREGSAFARASLLDVIDHVPLKYGPWRALKRIFKEAIERRDWEVFGALTARFDVAFSQPGNTVWERTPQEGFVIHTKRNTSRDVTRRTLGYLVRRAWRTLRAIGRSQPGLYVEVVVEVLRHYPGSVRQSHGMWVLNQILYREAGTYSETAFHVGWKDQQDLLENRAYTKLWRQPRVFESLVRLLESSQSTFIHRFCIDALKEDFAERLGRLDTGLLLRMARSDSAALHDFIAWWFEEKAQVSQDEYIARGMHTIIIALLESQSPRAKMFAARFIKAYKHQLVADIPLERVLWLVHHVSHDLHQLGYFLLDPEDSPYTLDLVAWTELLENWRTFDLARQAVLKLSAVEGLSLDWYKERLHSQVGNVVNFAFELLEDPKRQRRGEDWLSFYVDLLEPEGLNNQVARLALDNLQKLREDEDGKQQRFIRNLDDEFFRAMLIHPTYLVQQRLFYWLNEELVHVDQLGVDFLKGLLTNATWEAREWATKRWLGAYLLRWKLAERTFVSYVASNVRGILSNPSRVGIDELGHQWIIEHAEGAEKGESDYDFVKTMFLTRLPISALSDDPDAEDARLAGGRALFRLFGLGRSPEEEITRPHVLYRQLFTERYNRLRRHRDANAELLDDVLAIPNECLTFELFKRMSVDYDPHVRRLATIIADLELTRWAEGGEITFSDLSEIFTTGVESMRDYIRQATSTRPKSAACRIDLHRVEYFTAQAFFSCGFLHANESTTRDFGIQVLKDYPDKYGKNAVELLRYADSSDRRVREMVIRTLWTNFSSRPVTKAAHDYDESQPPVSAEASPALSEQYPTLYDLLRCVAFRLPGTHPEKVELGRTTTVTPSWRSKVALIETLRDIAEKDAAFAVLIVPLLSELLTSYGKTEHEACVVALARINHAHPDIEVWGDLAS